MPTRRDFVSQVTGASLMTAATSIQVARAWVKAPRIKSAIRREETTVRHAINGDNWHMSWAADDRQYAALCDGYAWLKQPNGMLNSRLMAVAGSPREAAFQDVPGYPELIRRSDDTHYYSLGTLALDGRIYQYLSTFNHEFFKAD